MPTCPRCGSADAFQISPNYFRCEGMVPLHSDDELGEYVPCAHEYQVGGSPVTSPQPLCDCGTFAIGRCRVCEEAVCGEHSAMFEDQRLCLEHHHEALAPRRKREAEAEAERRAIQKRREEVDREERKRAEEEEERQRRQRRTADAIQAALLVAIPIVAYLYMDAQKLSKPLNLVLTGALVGFLAVAAKIAYSGYPYRGNTVEKRFNWEADSFWFGLLGIPLGAAGGGILALVV